MFRTTAMTCVLGAALAGAAWPTGAQTGAGTSGSGDSAAILQDAIASAAALAPSGAMEGDLRAAATDLGEAERGAILGFYGARDFAPFWTEEGPGRAEALTATLADAGLHGLAPQRYRADDLARLADAGEAAEAEIALTLAYLRYAEDMTGGLLDPRAVDDEINLSPERPAPAALLERLEDASIGEALATLLPAGEEYRALLAERALLEEVARDGGWGEPVPEGGVLRIGDEDPAVPALRARLAALGHAGPGEGTGEGLAFDTDLEAALKAFQGASGLVDDGIFGRETRRALNAGPEDRIEQILVNLERIRWMGDDLGTRHVWVNIPDYTVSVFEDGARVYHTRSVVGEAEETRTPEFSDRMTYLVVNPTWYIPDSIAKRVYLPQLRRDPNVLRANNMRLFTQAGTEIDPGLVNFAELGDAFPFRVRQNPSASNALGRVKFMFPNQFAIYLHDTPNRELFDRDGRAFSNGCIRLAKPFELAHYLLAPQLDDPEGQFQTWLDAQSERYVTLDEPIAVHIVYRTAWADEEGVHFRRDVYGRDAAVLRALAERGVPMPMRESRSAAAEDRAG